MAGTLCWGPLRSCECAQLAATAKLLEQAWGAGLGLGQGAHPAKVGLEGLPDLLALGVAAMRDDIDDRVFIGSWSPKPLASEGGL